MEQLRQIRPLDRMTMRGVIPATIEGAAPTFEWVDPSTLWVEEAYQRDLGGAVSIRQIRKTVRGFDWIKFKPPICVRRDDGRLVVIDGQHTATACLTHPGIDKIPIVIVDAQSLARRAHAFVGHNRDRIGLSSMAIHLAEVAAGDSASLVIDRACKRAGVRIMPRVINQNSACRVGDTIAIGVIRKLARDHGEDLLARTLGVLVLAERRPLRADEIGATAATLLAAPDVDNVALAKVIAGRGPEIWHAQAAVQAIESGRQVPEVMGELWRADLVPVEAPPPAVKAPASAKSAPPIVKPAPPIAEPPPQQQVRVNRNGIVLDLRTGHVVTGGISVKLEGQEVAFVHALIRVSPSLLMNDQLVRHVYGRPVPDGSLLLKDLADKVNARFAGLPILVRELPKMGYSLGSR